MKERGEIGKEEGKKGSKAVRQVSLTFFEDGGRQKSDPNTAIAGSRRR